MEDKEVWNTQDSKAAELYIPHRLLNDFECDLKSDSLSSYGSILSFIICVTSSKYQYVELFLMVRNGFKIVRLCGES